MMIDNVFLRPTVRTLGVYFRKALIERPRILLWSIALLALSYSLYLTISYASQPLLDAHSFRQTQTALTSYWFIKEGFKFIYETPVAGAPWAIPFEFPIYQATVAYSSKLFNLELESTGRVISYIFLFLTVIPVVGITNALKLPHATILYFISILFSMPIYIYWGRSFMIETAALFFSVVAIKYFLDYMIKGPSIRSGIAFAAFSTIGILQKATTTLPVLIVLSFIFFVLEIRRSSSLIALKSVKNLAAAGVLFILPIVSGFAWVALTDQVKMENPLGTQLTSAALTKWNWGTFSQKVSLELWATVIWERIFKVNLGGVLGAFLILLLLVAKVEKKIKLIALGIITLGAIPLFLFTNLHIVHDYYQTANAIFLAYCVSLTISVLIAPLLGERVAVFTLLMIMSSNYISLNNGYLPIIKFEFSKANRDLAIGKILMREIPNQMQFVAFGNDWNSTFAFFSKRKSFTVPGWFKKYNEVVLSPAEFVEKERLGAIVSCATQKPSIMQLFDWVKTNGSWKVGETHGCIIITPEKYSLRLSEKTLHCQGHIDKADIELRDGKQLIVFTGWLADERTINGMEDDILLKLSNKDSNMPPIYIQALKVPRLDANKHLKLHNDVDIGFSRVIEKGLLSGNYEIELFKEAKDGFSSCGIRKDFQLP